MHVPALLKSGAITLSLLVIGAVLAGSVAEAPALTSTQSGNIAIDEPLPLAGAAPKKVASKNKKQLLKKAAKKEESTLLAAVQQQGIKEHHQKLADSVLRSLPPHCRTYLRNFYVQYKDVKQRGLGGKTTIIIDGTAPDTEFVGLLVHECAHVTHANMIGSPESGESGYKDGQDTFYADSPIVQFFAISWTGERILRADAKKEDFASGYAKNDAFEDFAETFAAYVLHRDSLRERAKTNAKIAAKLGWMETNLPLSEDVFGESDYSWKRDIPWDVTRLPLKLTASL